MAFQPALDLPGRSEFLSRWSKPPAFGKKEKKGSNFQALEVPIPSSGGSSFFCRQPEKKLSLKPFHNYPRSLCSRGKKIVL